MYDWNDVIAKIDEDIAEYLMKRYKEYCKDKSESSSTSGGEAQRERHKVKRNQLVKFGIKLKEKLNFFQNESRKELFKQIYKGDEALGSFFNKRYDNFCKELDKTNKALLLYKQKDPYTLHCEKSDKEEQLLEYKEIMKNSRFVESIDKRRADYEKKKANYEKRKAEDEKRRAEEKARKERIIKRKGHSNIKPIDFYEKLYLAKKNDEIIDEDDKKDYMEEQQEKDLYFEEHGIPKGEWTEFDVKEGKCFTPLRDEENSLVDRYPEIVIYSSADSFEENQKHLNRCKEMKEIIDDLLLQDYMQHFKWLQGKNLFNVEILQEYLTKGHLVTIQIAELVFRIIFWLRWMLTTNLNKPHHVIENHPAREYKIDVYSDDFDIRKIKQDVAEFIRINEGIILTPLEYLKVYLKKHDNRITIKEYAKLIDKSEYIASKTLKKFEADKKLKSEKEYQGLNVFYT